MLVIGLTGGICSGKTTVANLFSELHIEIIDSDVIARSVVEPNTMAYEKIIQHFGENILTNELAINRKKLAAIIFNDLEEKVWLEKLLHPLIYSEIRRRIKNVKSPYCIVVIPLLVETKSFDLVNRVLLVDTTTKQQIIRAQQRDKLTTQQIEKIMQTQATRGQRISYADDIIFNNNNLEELKKQVEKLHNYYLSLSEKEK